jgi:hypothetical protein
MTCSDAEITPDTAQSLKAVLGFERARLQAAPYQLQNKQRL